MTLINGDCLTVLKQYPDNHFDLIVSDPPYGIQFMNKDFDKALVGVEVWKECFRVLKDGKFAFIMCSPRQDVLSRMIISLEDAGFRTNYTSIYWTYASGFPKAANVSKLIDKKNGRQESEYKQLGDYIKQKRIESKIPTKEISSLFPSKTGGLTGCLWNWENAENVPTREQWQILKEKLNLDNRFDELIEREEAEREIIGKYRQAITGFNKGRKYGDVNITKPATPEAKKMEGAYVGFQPKPAVEVILVVSKGKSLTWLDDCRIPYSSDADQDYTLKINSRVGDNKGVNSYQYSQQKEIPLVTEYTPNQKGRFPANILVSDDILNDGVERKTGEVKPHIQNNSNSFSDLYNHGVRKTGSLVTGNKPSDSGSYSRYFSLDSWAKTFPFLICPKASKSERNKGCEDMINPKTVGGGGMYNQEAGRKFGSIKSSIHNNHPTVKPLKLMSYLVTLGSREGDLVLDPFCGSGTTCIAAETLHRNYVGIELNEEYYKIAQARLVPYLSQTKLL